MVVATMTPTPMVVVIPGTALRATWRALIMLLLLFILPFRIIASIPAGCTCCVRRPIIGR
jgi:hypothetical protein